MRDAELHRLRGEIELARGTDCATVEAAYGQAIAVAQAQQAKSLELRAATSLARLWQQQGKQAQAYRLLSAIHGWFTEGFDTPDLVAAQELLTDLSLTKLLKISPCPSGTQRNDITPIPMPLVTHTER
ncbi:MAG: hypothetical protein R2932_21925 [Caldilineaceae bacterium]